MSGHSKWVVDQAQEGRATDAKRGKLFTKLARAITVAAREGGGDPDGNPTLATAIQKARDASMPKDNIQRAIDRGTGEGADGGGDRAGPSTRATAPAASAILVEALTDNRNRTGAEVRHAFDKHGGSLGEPGSVAWMFEKRGVILRRRRALRRGRPDRRRSTPAPRTSREDGDVLQGAHGGRATWRPCARRSRAPGSRSSPPSSSMEPKNTVEVEEGDAPALLRLIDALEDHDDVDAVHANFDIPEEIIERVAG